MKLPTELGAARSSPAERVATAAAKAAGARATSKWTSEHHMQILEGEGNDADWEKCLNCLVQTHYGLLAML